MADRCPHLDYRDAADGSAFETPRAYCTVVDRFVQPMRADVCNGRGRLSPAEHCEFYREREGIEDPWLLDGPDGSGESHAGQSHAGQSDAGEDAAGERNDADGTTRDR